MFCHFLKKQFPLGKPYVRINLKSEFRQLALANLQSYPVILRILRFFSSPFSRKIYYHPWLLSSPNITGSSCQASFLPLSFSQVPSLSPWTIGKSRWITRQNPRQRCSRRTTTAHIGTINCYITKTFGPQKDEKWKFPNVWVFSPKMKGRDSAWQKISACKI